MRVTSCMLMPSRESRSAAAKYLRVAKVILIHGVHIHACCIASMKAYLVTCEENMPYMTAMYIVWHAGMHVASPDL